MTGHSRRRAAPAAARRLAFALAAGCGLALLLPQPWAFAADAAAAALGPQELMNDVAQRMFAALDTNRTALRKNPEAVYPLVEQILLPHFDTEFAAQLILAQSWRTATPEQRRRFIDALYKALLRTYGGALADFTADRLRVLPFRGDPTATHSTVRTEVRRSSGATAAVDYAMHKTDQGWKAFDVIIEGISYVKNYRADLGAEVSKKGLDEVISRLEHDGLDVSAVGSAHAAAAPAR